MVVLVWHLDPVGLLDLNLELLACFNKSAENFIGSLEVRSALLRVLVDHDPLLFLEVDGFLNGEFSQDRVVDMDDLISFD